MTFELTGLDKWLREVSQHLHMIEAGCEIIDRHLSRMEYRPDFVTRCEAMMEETETRLQRALDRVRQARETYGRKSVG